MLKYIKGVAVHSRTVTIRAPSEIRRIILDSKLSEFRQSGPPRGNLVIIFETTSGCHVWKESKLGTMHAEIEALQRLEGFQGFFPTVTQHSSRFDWFVTDFFPNVEWSTSSEMERAFLQTLERAHEKLGTSSKPAAQLIRDIGLTNADLELSLKNEGLRSAEIQEILSGDMTDGLVYLSRPKGNMLKGAVESRLQLIDFEKAHQGPVIIDFEPLWDTHNREIRLLFSGFGGSENLSADQQILFWRGLQAIGIQRTAFQKKKN